MDLPLCRCQLSHQVLWKSTQAFNGTIFNDLASPLPHILRSLNYLTSHNSKIVQDRAYNGRPIVSRIWSIERRHFERPWMTPTHDFKVTPLFNAEYPRNNKKHKHGFNGILMGTYTHPTQPRHTHVIGLHKTCIINIIHDIHKLQILILVYIHFSPYKKLSTICNSYFMLFMA